jgi:hypothetical protein
MYIISRSASEHEAGSSIEHDDEMEALGDASGSARTTTAARLADRAAALPEAATARGFASAKALREIAETKRKRNGQSGGSGLGKKRRVAHGGVAHAKKAHACVPPRSRARRARSRGARACRIQ